MNKYLVIVIICSFLTGCLCKMNVKIDNTEKINKRNYYLLVDDYSCISNTPLKTRIKSWKNRIEFVDDEVLIYGDLCNDQAEIFPFLADEFKFSKDLSTLIYQSESYIYSPEKPQLCEGGWWCPTENQKEK
jgi:hypothetical protein